MYHHEFLLSLILGYLFVCFKCRDKFVNFHTFTFKVFLFSIYLLALGGCYSVDKQPSYGQPRVVYLLSCLCVTHIFSYHRVKLW